MMNANIFQALVNAAAQMDDTQGAMLLSNALGILSMSASAPSAPVSAPTPAPAQAPAPAPEPKPRKVAQGGVDVTLNVEPSDPKSFACTVPYGDGRKAAKAALREAGFKWDDVTKAYWGTTAQAKALGLSKRKPILHITQEQLQASWDKAAERAARKAAKQGA